MKLLACLASFIPVLCYAATIDLPLPTVIQLNPGATCARYAHPHAYALGFDSTGNYVMGAAKDYVSCGSSGHGGNIHTYSYCASFVWDLSGNLIQTTLGTCPSGLLNEVYTNAGGYQLETNYSYNYGYFQFEYPVLVTP